MNNPNTDSSFLLPASQSGTKRGFIGGVVLANLVLWMAIFTPIQMLLPIQIDHNFADDRELILAWIAGIGAMISMIMNPIFGALSDSTRSKYGRRLPWFIFGLLFTAISLSFLSRQSDLIGMIFGWCGVQMFGNAMMVSLSAEIPDRVPSSQYATVGSLMGCGQPLGLVVGGVIISLSANSVALSYDLIWVLLVILSIPYVLLALRSPGISAHQIHERVDIRRIWLDLGSYPDFVWAWINRFLVSLSMAISTLYFYFYLKNVVGYEAAFPGKKTEDGVFDLIIIYTVMAILGAIVSGILSDRMGRRKIFMTVSSILLTIGCLILGCSSAWALCVLACALLGAGFGVFSSVGQAVANETMPDINAAGGYLGLVNIANSAPQVLAPAIAAGIFWIIEDYSILYCTAALFAMLGAWVLRTIKSIS